MLANALEANTSITAFTLLGNPVNGDHLIRPAIINTKAPITHWNDQPLSEEILEARRRRKLELAVPIPTASSLVARETEWLNAEQECSRKRVKCEASEIALVNLDKQIEDSEKLTKTLKEMRFELKKQITQDKQQVAAGEKEASKLQKQWALVARQIEAGGDAKPPAATAPKSPAAPKTPAAAAAPKTPVAAAAPKAPVAAAAAAPKVPVSPPATATPKAPAPTCPDCKSSKMTRKLVPCNHQTCGVCVRKAIKNGCCVCLKPVLDSVII